MFDEQAQPTGPRLPEAVRSEFKVWWARISGDLPSGSQRADRAVLRRAHDLTAIASTSAYQHVYRKLLAANDGNGWPRHLADRLAAAVGLAVHVKPGRRQLSLPQAMSKFTEAGGPPDDTGPQMADERNPVSELRFKRLLDSPDVDALFVGLRRVMPMIEERVDPLLMLDDLFHWGHAVKKRWAYQYTWPSKEDR